MTWAYLIAAVVMIVATILLRRRRPDSGMTTYRRHIDALSPEARQNVRDRAQNSNRRKP